MMRQAADKDPAGARVWAQLEYLSDRSFSLLADDMWQSCLELEDYLHFRVVHRCWERLLHTVAGILVLHHANRGARHLRGFLVYQMYLALEAYNAGLQAGAEAGAHTGDAVLKYSIDNPELVHIVEQARQRARVPAA